MCRHPYKYMSSLFEAGPWDNAEAVAGVHVFDKKRKLLYGDEHDRAAHAEDPSAYSAPREEHRLHPLWRRGAIKYLQELCSKTKEEVKIPKKVGRAREKPWPGDLGKDHAVFEEFVAAGALSVHQDDSLGVYALVHRAALHRMADKYLNVDAPPAASAAAGAAAGAGAVAGPPFVAAAAFDGARAGYVSKRAARAWGITSTRWRPGAAAAAAAVRRRRRWLRCLPAGSRASRRKVTPTFGTMRPRRRRGSGRRRRRRWREIWRWCRRRRRRSARRGPRR